MPHVFDERYWRILESDWRRRILPVEPLLNIIKNLKERNVAFDIGSGTGYFTVHLAGIFRKVYAVEISLKMAEILSSKGLRNIGIIISERPPDVDFDIDFVLFADSLHEIVCKEEYIRWAGEKSKYIAVIDWKKESEYGPKVEDRIDKEFVKELLSEYFVVREIEAYRYHFFLFGERYR